MSGFKCAIKANEGIFYPLQNAIFSIPKPPIYIPHRQIIVVTFDTRAGSSIAATTRLFEMKISTDSGQEYSFTNIPREEYDGLRNYFKSSQIKIKNEAKEVDSRINAEHYESDSSEEGSKPKNIMNLDLGGEDESSGN